MKTRKLPLLLILLGAAALACVFNRDVAKAPNALPRTQIAQGLQLEIPDARWEPVFFEALEERTQKAGISSLRKTVLPDHDLEVRFWYDHFEVIQGLIIRRSAEKWSATYLWQKDEQEPSSVQQESLGVPKSGWEVSWKMLTSAGILTLPDGSTTKCRSDILDGIGYVVETNVNRHYRTYRYGNPQFANCDEAKRILSIETILSEEFSLHPPQK
jgi:hypothetical protein